jgi:hypothetical protein
MADRHPREWEHTLGWLVLLTLPLLLIALNSRWIMTSPGMVDAWVYYGYFTNVEAFQQAFGETYYGSRLAWILPGALIHELLPSMAANYVLHLGVYYAALFSVYFTVRRVVGTRAALLAAVFVGCYPYFLGAVGWHYVDGAGLAYYAVALACLTAAIDSRRRRVWLTGAGAAFAGSVHTNVVWSIMLPALAYYYVVTTRESRTGRVATDWTFALLGSTALTLIIAAASVASGGAFLFFMPSVDYAIKSPPAQYQGSWLDVSTWVIRGRFLLFPAAVLVSMVYFRATRVREPRLVRLLAEHYVLAWAALAAFDLAGGALLAHRYYTSYLIPGMALAVGVLLGDAVRGLSARQYALAVGVAVTTFAVVLEPSITARLSAPPGYFSLGTVVGPFLVVLIAGALARLWTNVLTLIVLIICAGIANAVTVDGRVWQRDSVGRHDLTYRATVAASDALTALDPGASARLWYNTQEPLGRVFLSIASTRLWGYRLVGERFPSLVNSFTNEVASIAPGDQIAVLSTDDDPFPEAKAALQAADLDTVVVGRREIAAGDLRFHLTLLRAGIDQARLDATPLPVSSDVFLKGSSKGAAERVTVDAEDNLVQIVTNRSTYDWQVVSRPIALSASRRYLAEFEVDIPRGGAGFHVVSTKTQAVLASRYWCNPPRRASRQQVTFETGTDDSVRLALSNCGVAAVVSDFAVKDLQVRAYRARE